ncbi:MAG: LLM class flavin-dependent oxidoreductase [Dehalococcoidia bacterium]|nr:LLM class flavin-dependent oxidoreductase [Dehalococcoidia bacterium]
MTDAPLRFGWFIPTYGDSPRIGDNTDYRPPSLDMFVRVARAAEDAGFDYALVPVADVCWEAWISCSMISAQTSKIKMLVAARPGLIQPTLTAKMVSTFDQLSQGRVYINLIAGGGPAEMAADGVFYNHDERYAAMDETVTIMKRSWTEKDPVTFEGDFFRVENAVVRPRPYQQPHPPFFLGGISPAAQEVGGKHASVYLFWGDVPERIAGDIESVRQAAVRHGREHELRYGMRLQVLVRETEEEAWAAADALIAPEVERLKQRRMAGMGAESHADARMREMAEKTAGNNYRIAPHLWAGITAVRHGAGVMVVGNPQQVAETLEEFVQLGCRDFCLSGYPHDEEAERFGRLVMPYFPDRLEREVW